MNQSFCPAAWNSIYVDPTGSIRNCCVASEDIGTVDDDISNVFNGNKNIWIKQQMLEGNLVDSCRQCWPDSQHSMRDGFLHDYYRPETADKFDSVNKFQIQYLDLRWHNTCNFACVYCGHALVITQDACVRVVHWCCFNLSVKHETSSILSTGQMKGHVKFGGVDCRS